VRGAIATVGVVLLAAAAGCSPEATEEPSPTSTPGPAKVYLESALGFTADDAAQAALRMEESIAGCMAEQGFEYVPDTSGYQHVETSEIDPPPGSHEFAEQFGYGFAALPEGMSSEGAPGPNPNDELMAAMSPEELAAYQVAMWGEGIEEESSEGGGGLGGCFGAARNEVWGDPDEDPVRAALEDEIARIDAEAAPMDPAVARAANQWSDCMSDAGHPGFATPADAEQAAWDSWMAFNDAIAAEPMLGAEDADGGVAGQADLAAKEAALATADWDCRAAAGYDAVWREARDRLQQEYVDGHRAELDAWVESFS